MPKKKTAALVETVEEARAREEFVREKELGDLKAILKDERVRDFLWRLIAWCNPFGEHFQTNFGVVGHNLGRRAAAMWVWNEITEADFEALIAMQLKNRDLQIEAENASNVPPETDPEP